MYTGIVQGAFPLLSVERKPGLNTVSLVLPKALLAELAIGASVGVDGVCLTVSRLLGEQVYFDIMQQTLAVTTLGQLQAGDKVNIERSAKHGAEIGGHIISGHVDGCAQVMHIERPDNNCFITYRLPAEHMKYVFAKGFIALNGCSLTIAAADKSANTITVCFIPETLRVTTHGDKRVGDTVNFEVDRQTQAIVDTVQSLLREHPELLSLK